MTGTGRPFGDVVWEELQRAEKKYAPLNNGHEAYIVIREKLEEFWKYVRKGKGGPLPASAAKELVQLAAMAWRAIKDLKFEEESR